MKGQNDYILADQFMKEQKYTAIAEDLCKDSQLICSWLKKLTQIYQLNPIFMIQKDYDHEKYGHACLMARQVNSFVHSHYTINHNHCEYFSKFQENFSTSNFIKYTNNAIQGINQISHKKKLAKKFKQEFQNIVDRLIHQKQNEEQFFKTMTWNQRFLSIEKYIETEAKISSGKYQVEVNNIKSMAHLFEKFLFFYRKKIIKNKCKFIMNILKLSREFLTCLGQLITLGTNQIQIMVFETKKMHLLNSRSEIRSSIRNSKIQMINELKQNHMNRINIYKQKLTILQQFYRFNTKKTKPLPEKNEHKQIQQLFHGNQSLYKEIVYTDQIVQLLYQSRSNIVNEISTTLLELEKKKKSLLKKIDVYEILEGDKMKTMRESRRPSILDLEKIQDQFQISDVQAIVNSLFAFMLREYEGLGQNCIKIIQKFSNKHNHSQSLMQLSCQFNQIKLNQIKPGVRQMWLWKDWRDFKALDSLCITNRLQIQPIKIEYNKIKQYLEQQNSGTKYSCMISLDKKYKCIVKLQPHSIVLTSDKKNIDFIIPKEYITQIEKFKEKIVVKTKNHAKFRLGYFKNIDIDEVLTALEDQYLKGGQKLKMQDMQKKRVELTDEEIQYIPQRRKKIQAQIPSIQKYTKYGEIVIDTDIQTIYEIIFTDSGIFPISSSYSSFFEYTNKKLKNYNFTATKYDKPGPSFYTGDKQSGVTFMNCPTFSQRHIQQDHPLPPIPFIPKQCHCVQNQKMYWISHEQLLYKVEVRQTTPEMMKNFGNNFIYCIKKIDDKNIKIDFLSEFVMIQQSRMKNILKNGAQGELKQMVPKVLDQLTKAIKLYQRMLKNSEQSNKQNQNNPENSFTLNLNAQKPQKSTISNQQFQYYLVGGLIFTVVVNIILHIILK